MRYATSFTLSLSLVVDSFYVFEKEVFTQFLLFYLFYLKLYPLYHFLSLCAGICIDKSLKIPRQKLPDTFDKILAQLRESSSTHTETEDEQQVVTEVKAKVVVMFVNEDNCRQLINASMANHMTDVFYWLASDSWGAKRVPVDKQEWAAEGTVTILPQRQVIHSMIIDLYHCNFPNYDCLLY